MAEGEQRQRQQQQGSAGQQQGPAGPQAQPPPPFDLERWRASEAFVGEPPPLKFLVDGVLPLGKPVMIAAQVGLGKSTLLLDVALTVAGGLAPDLFGGRTVTRGAAVVFSGEDDVGTIHRRIARRCPGGDAPPRELYLVPFPDIGGARPLVTSDRDGLHATAAFDEQLAGLKAVPNLTMVALDPLQMFAGCDITADPAAAQAVCSALARMAAETGATVIVAHHFRNDRSNNDPIDNIAAARNAIRGTTGLVDGLRAVYALWSAAPDDEASRELAERLHAEPPLIYGALVKANEVTTGAIHIYTREKDGSLRDQTEWAEQMRADMRQDHAFTDEMFDALVQAIADEAKAGRPFSRTGKSGVFERREMLPEPFKEHVGKHKLVSVVDQLLIDKRLVQAIAGRSSQAQWLDVPEGPFAPGEGKFEPGATR